MPNWTTNRLTVTGPVADVAAFVNDHEVAYQNDEGEECFTPLSFAASVPEPHDPRQEGYDWYEWRNAHWGTKWDLKGKNVLRRRARDGALVEYQFDTAWDAPEQWVVSTRALYPALKLVLRSVDEGDERDFPEADEDEEEERYQAELEKFWEHFFAGSDFDCVETWAKPRF